MKMTVCLEEHFAHHSFGIYVDALERYHVQTESDSAGRLQTAPACSSSSQEQDKTAAQMICCIIHVVSVPSQPSTA